jgi:hypothetical protein
MLMLLCVDYYLPDPGTNKKCNQRLVLMFHPFPQSLKPWTLQVLKKRSKVRKTLQGIWKRSLGA